MNFWFTAPDAPVDKRPIKRFDPEHWTVDFPRGAMASLTTRGAAHSLTVEAHFLRLGDLVGLIWESADRWSHPAHRRETATDYSGCKLSFRWQASGLAGLDAVNGPTLTIEGKDAAGAAATWYVRLWNYASGTGSDARVTLDFDALDGGFLLPSEAVRVHPGAIERMFVSLVPPDYAGGAATMRGAVANATLTLSEIACDGPGSVIEICDAMAPDCGLSICSGYDDQYHLAPSRIVEGMVRAGYSGTINHYVGMSHFPALGGDGKVEAGVPMCAAAMAWHRELARCAKAHGFELIWSLSLELLDMLCPDEWKQRDADGAPAATGYVPPSTLVSPANDDAISYLTSVAEALVALSVEAGLTPRFQLGEPWWWVTGDGRICLYDDAAKAGLGGAPVAIGDVGGMLSAAQKSLLDEAGAVLAGASGQIFAAVKAAAADAVTHLLVYLPGLFDPRRPEVKRANLPPGWAKPAADVLQLEDYEWVTDGREALRTAARDGVEARLGYARDEQHYLAGYAANGPGEWARIVAAADGGRELGVGETFVWAWPQVARDGLIIFEGEETDPMDAFADVMFPIAIGQEASVAPGFSTNVVTSAGGHEFRNANWASARLRFDAGPGVRGEDELGTLIRFFRARRGAAQAFRFRDPFDHSSAGMSGVPTASDQWLGDGDGASTRFELVKRYEDGEIRRITRPVAGSVTVAIDGVTVASGWTLEAKGVVQFDAPPGDEVVVTAGFLFDVPVRFGDDRLEVNRASFAAGEAPSVPLVEVREDSE